MLKLTKQTLRTMFLEFSVQYLFKLNGLDGSEQRLPDIVRWTKFSSLRLTAVMMAWCRRRKMEVAVQNSLLYSSRLGPLLTRPLSEYFIIKNLNDDFAYLSFFCFKLEYWSTFCDLMTLENTQLSPSLKGSWEGGPKNPRNSDTNLNMTATVPQAMTDTR